MSKRRNKEEDPGSVTNTENKKESAAGSCAEAGESGEQSGAQDDTFNDPYPNPVTVFFKEKIIPLIRRVPKKTGIIALSSIAGLICISVLTGYLIVKNKPVVADAAADLRKVEPMRVSYSVSEPQISSDAAGRRAPLYINFYSSAAPINSAGKAPSGTISFAPAIAGTWQWLSDDRLVFTPDTAWPLGQEYRISFDKNVFASHVSVDKKVYFSIPDFNVYMTDPEFYIDPLDSSIKRILFSLQGNFPLNTASVEKAVSIVPDISAASGRLPAGPVKYTVSYSDDGRTAYIVSDPVGMPADNVTVNVTVAKGISSSYGGSTTSAIKERLTVPGMTQFARILSADHQLVKTDDQLYDQVFIINTKGTVSSAALTGGMELYVLPKDKPAEPGLKERKNYDWSDMSPSEMTKTVLDASKKIGFESIPAELAYSSVNSFRIHADPSSYLYLRIKQGTEFYGGYYLGRDYETIFQVKKYPKELSILSAGTVLSLSGGKQLAMYSRGVSDVRYKISRFMPDDLNHLISQSNGRMDNFSFDRYSFDEDNIAESYYEYQKIPSDDARQIQYFSFNFEKYLNTVSSKNLRNGLFLFSVKDDNASLQDKRLILVTDLGLFVKSNTDKTRDIFVQSIATGRPVSGAEVSILGLNGTALVSAVTSYDGHVSIPPLSGYSGDHEPVAYVVTKGSDLSFMPYNERGRVLDYSNFAVGGVYGAADKTLISAYMFSDRGMYRPGDEVRLGLIIKAGDWNIDLKGTPLECSVVDSNGSEIYTKQMNVSEAGFEEIRFSTQEYSPTGEYTVHLYLIKEKRRISLGSETVKIEEFIPDNLTVSAGFSAAAGDGWLQNSGFSGTVSLRNLFGTPASGNEIKAQLTLSPGFPSFRRYADYSFSNPYSSANSYTDFLGKRETDGNGEAVYTFDLEKFEKASYRLDFYVEGYEKGSGRNVSDQASVYVSPLPYFIGFKADGSLQYIPKNSTRKMSFIAVGPDLATCASDKVTLALQEIRYVSALVKQSNGVYKYQSVKKLYPVSSEEITIPASGYVFDVPTSSAGDYVLTLTDGSGLEFNRTLFSVVGDENTQRSLTRTAELELKLDKSDFKNGEDATVFIKAPYAGSGLITVERDKVYSWVWFTSDGTSSVQKIRIPGGLEGNGYINVMYSRSSSSPEIYMSPFCYGSVPFSISKESRTNRITLDVPEEVKPGTEYLIKYSTSKKSKIVVMAVDEGILQTARYQMPDPLAYFFKKRALEVKTSQFMDLVLPEFSVLQTIGAAGGSEGMELLSRNLNPFKRKRNEPVAYWSGIIESDTQTRTLSYRIPDYFNGTIRVMAVAVSGDTLGTARSSSLVRDTFIMIPNMPLAAAPGDEFDVSVTVANNSKKEISSPITVTAVPQQHLSLVSASSVKLDIPQGKDVLTTFRVKANDLVGGSGITFTATRGDESSAVTAAMSIRPSMPYQVWINTAAVKNSAAQVDVDKRLYDEFAERSISLSYMPLSLANGLLFYLEKYPYGCTEQITSATMAYLYPRLLQNSGKTQQDAAEAIANTVSVLQSRLKSDGSLGLWTYRSASYDMVTVHAALFLTEAQSKGYFVPSSLMSSILSSVRSIASGSGSYMSALAARAFAVYVLTRNEIVTTSYIESLRKDIAKVDGAESSYPGLYLAASYSLLKQDKEAAALLNRVVRKMKKDDSYLYCDTLHFLSVYLDILSRHFPSRLGVLQADHLEMIAEELAAYRYTTFSAAYALMALENYAAAVPSAESGGYTLTETVRVKNNAGKEAKEDRTLTARGENVFGTQFDDAAMKVVVRSNETFPLFFQVTQAGFERNIPKEPVKLGLEVFREYTAGGGKKLSSVKLGDEVEVHVKFRSLQNKRIRNVAIVDMLPAGFEADIDSIRKAESSNSGWNPDYVDIREDRVIIFGTVTEDIKEFTYKVRAINTGTYTVPPLFAEAMYDKAVRALAPQQPVVITDK